MADTFTVTKGKVGVEDCQFGTGTFTRTSNDGTTVLPIRKINAAHIPIQDLRDIFKSAYLEGVVEELYDLFTDSHIMNWYYVDENNEILHGMGDVINQPAVKTTEESWWMKDSFDVVIMGMGDVINQ